MEFHVVEQPDIYLGTVVGDCVHNLRSSLDAAIHELAETHGEEAKRTQFPILNNKSSKVPSVGANIPSAALAFLDTVQPYCRTSGADADPLAIVRDLSNTDKHRTISMVAARLVDTSSELVLPDGRSFGGPARGVVAHHESPIAAYQFPEPFDADRYGDVTIQAGGQAFVAIDHPPAADRPAVDVLREISAYIRAKVLPGLAPFVGLAR